MFKTGDSFRLKFQRVFLLVFVYSKHVRTHVA